MSLVCSVAEYLAVLRRAEYEALRVAFGLPDYTMLSPDGVQIVAGVTETLECLARIMREPPAPGRAGEAQP